MGVVESLTSTKESEARNAVLIIIAMVMDLIKIKLLNNLMVISADTRI